MNVLLNILINYLYTSHLSMKSITFTTLMWCFLCTDTFTKNSVAFCLLVLHVALTESMLNRNLIISRLKGGKTFHRHEYSKLRLISVKQLLRSHRNTIHHRRPHVLFQ